MFSRGGADTRFLKREVQGASTKLTLDDKQPEKWHEYAETEVGFPESWSSWECGVFYDAEYIQDWFKRCMENKPDLPKDKLFSERFMLYGIEMYKWYEKWFSQFRKQGFEDFPLTKEEIIHIERNMDEAHRYSEEINDCSAPIVTEDEES